jgi:hypothetical protein
MELAEVPGLAGGYPRSLTAELGVTFRRPKFGIEIKRRLKRWRDDWPIIATPISSENCADTQRLWGVTPPVIPDCGRARIEVCGLVDG